MSKRPKNRPPHRTQGGASFGIGQRGVPAHRDDEPELHREVLARLHPNDPLPLLAYASTLAAAFEERSPWEKAASDQPTLPQLISMLRSTGERPTDALLLVLKEFAGNDVLARRVAMEVAGRRHPLPRWLTQLDQFRASRAFALGHVLGDGENVVIEITAPAGILTLVLYIDHNMGTVVKDGYVLDEAFDFVVGRLNELSRDETGVTSGELSLAEARARAEQAIANGRMVHPPFESDTWPNARPFVEWMLRRMPSGGHGYPDPEDPDVAPLIEQLAADADPSGFDARPGSDDRDIAETLLEFAANYLGGDPLRWSPVTVEILLADLFPRKVHADARYLDRVPDVMREVIVYAHGVRDVPGSLTLETLAAVDRYEPEYRRQVGVPRNLRSELMREFDPGDPYAFFKALLAAQVGGVDAIESLDVSPLPARPLDLDVVAPDIHDRVSAVAALAADTADALFDAEMRTAVLRVIERVAASDPTIFRRNSRVEMTAAALVWIAANVNDGLREVSVQGLMRHLGQKGSPSQRAEPMLRALGVATTTGWAYDPSLGDPTLLTSRKRQSLAERWEALQEADWLDEDEE
ncbi:MAG: hypothetical protein QM611_08135 [Microbacterium sp.]|uniref:hypothetical protein n=1 Tax=Microbacterium sp. TaxID=51671 RepID=UPI0039E2C0DD